MLRGYRIRLLPTQEQELLFSQKLGAARFVWNWGLALQMENFRNNQNHLSAYELRDRLRELKNTDKSFAWLSDYGITILNGPLFDLDKAYKAFFKYRRAGGKKYSDKAIKRATRQGRKLTSYEMLKHPKFKKRGKCKEAFPVRYDTTTFKGDTVRLERIGKIRYQTDLDLSKVTKIFNPRVSKENNRWILAFSAEVENQDYELNDYALGIDVGVKDLATVRCNNKTTVYKNINKTAKLKRMEKRLNRLHRKASKCEDTSKRKDKAYDAVRRQYQKISNVRHTYTHQVTAEIVGNLPKAIGIEDLNVAGMMKNKHLSKHIQDCKWSELLRQIEYKSADRGISVVKADRFYPSSKTCSGCGYVKKDLKLKDRKWLCPECNTLHNRDENAAINLERYASAS